MGDATEPRSRPLASVRRPEAKGLRRRRPARTGLGDSAGRPRLSWVLRPEDMCGGPCITDAEIYAPIEESRRRGEIHDEWSQAANVAQSEYEASGAAVSSMTRVVDDIRFLHLRLSSGATMNGDPALVAAIGLDPARLGSAPLEPQWLILAAAVRLTVLVQRFRPTTDDDMAVKTAAMDFIYDRSTEWLDIAQGRTHRAVATSLSVVTSPVATVGDLGIYPGDLDAMAREQEQRDLLNKILTLGFPIFMLGSMAQHTPVLGWFLKLSIDPKNTLDDAWDTITNPGQIIDDMQKAKEEHGWNAFNPAYWAMVNFYESGQAFERWRDTGDPRHALEGIDRFGQGFGSTVDTVGLATGATALSPRRVAVDAPRKVDNLAERATSANRARERSKAATASRRQAIDRLAQKLSRVSANPFLDPEVLAEVAVVAYHLAKEGVTAFDAFIKKLSAERAYRDLDVDALSPDELDALKGATKPASPRSRATLSMRCFAASSETCATARNRSGEISTKRRSRQSAHATTASVEIRATGSVRTGYRRTDTPSGSGISNEARRDCRRSRTWVVARSTRATREARPRMITPKDNAARGPGTTRYRASPLGDKDR